MNKEMKLLMHIILKCHYHDVTITISGDEIELRKAGKIRPYVVYIPRFIIPKTSMSILNLIDTAISELVAKETEENASEGN